MPAEPTDAQKFPAALARVRDALYLIKEANHARGDRLPAFWEAVDRLVSPSPAMTEEGTNALAHKLIRKFPQIEQLVLAPALERETRLMLAGVSDALALRERIAQADRVAELEARSLEGYLSQAAPWSEQTFGPGKRTMGITRHIEKELAEIREDPEDSSEWIDVIILGLDGYWRSGGDRTGITEAIFGKLKKNQAREWPPNNSEDVPVEHVGGTAHRIAELKAEVDKLKAQICALKFEREMGGHHHA
jgi:uncharacterized small protein (DUF1192 family)